MPKNPRERYWVYVHDKDDDFIETLTETDNWRHALDEAGSYIKREYNADNLVNGNTIRIVDNTLDGGTTVWMAGPKSTNAVPV